LNAREILHNYEVRKNLRDSQRLEKRKKHAEMPENTGYFGNSILKIKCFKIEKIEAKNRGF